MRGLFIFKELNVFQNRVANQFEAVAYNACLGVVPVVCLHCVIENWYAAAEGCTQTKSQNQTPNSSRMFDSTAPA